MADLCLIRVQELNNNNVEETLNDSEGAIGGSGSSSTDDSQTSSELAASMGGSIWTEEELDRDPHREVFYDAYRDVPSEPEMDDSTENVEELGERKPLSLIDDWELWDYMDEETLKKRLKNHPELLEEITRKRKRRALEENDDEDLCAVMEKHAKVTKLSEHATLF
ncbi:uncharacterized protein LOC129747489 [Uranotaenia lowii]|uniref:uncharacterized protein LOC129747489 n=1 Tax=Uranotaenia lowii TaxID=190385 RepID=UPI002479AFFC|nr:uncharacterized protein LOC129747489 [Uranotaenia lowii]